MPGFDEYLLGYQDRSAVLDAENWQAIVPGGRVVGTWRRKSTPAGVTVTPMPFEPLSTAAVTRLTAAIAGYGRFLGSPVVVSPAG